MTLEELQHKKDLLNAHKTRARALEKKIAKYGISASSTDVIDLEEVSDHIVKLEAEIALYEATSNTTPNDTLRDAFAFENSSPLQKLAPAGWTVIDTHFLAQFNRELEPEKVLSFFDGRVPFWEDALSPNIPRRLKVEEIKQRIIRYRSRNQLAASLIIGAGGEGKSTVLRQVICDLVNATPAWNILWSEDANSAPTPDSIKHLIRNGGSWVIASDNADTLAKGFFDLAKYLRSINRNNFHLLVCAVDIDWHDVGANKWAWNDYIDLKSFEMYGIEEEDANAIVQRWNDYGVEGLGELAKFSNDLPKAARRLVAESKLSNIKEQGTFLGAMLKLRYEGHFDEYVRKILVRLERRPSLGRNLAEIYAYIVALHAIGFPYLSKFVLAEALNCTPGDILKYVTGPLGAEAAGKQSGPKILARHQRIAEVAKDLLATEFYQDFEEIYVELVYAAQKVFKGNRQNLLEPGKWNKLPHLLFHKNKELGIRLAQVFLETSPEDTFYRNQLASLLRNANRKDESVQLYLDAPEEARIQRSFFSEWAVGQGLIGNRHLDAWLVGVALADGQRVTLTVDDAKICLNGLASCFLSLTVPPITDQVFAAAAASALRLGLLLPTTEKTTSTEMSLQRLSQKIAPAHAQATSITSDIANLQLGIIKAWQHRENELPDWVTRGDQLEFEAFERLLRRYEPTARA